MPITAKLVLCSCLCAYDPTGVDAARVPTIQQQAAIIKASSLRESQKGVRLAPLFRPGTPESQVEKILRPVCRSNTGRNTYGGWGILVIVKDGKVTDVERY